MSCHLLDDQDKLSVKGAPCYQGKLPSSQTTNNVSCAYEEYLFLLQRRNKLLRKLKKKSKKQINLERKEQGFSLYLNGANIDAGKEKCCSRSKCYPSHDNTETYADIKDDLSDFKLSRKKWLTSENSNSEKLYTQCEGSPYLKKRFQKNHFSNVKPLKIDASEIIGDDEDDEFDKNEIIPEQLRLSFMDLKKLRRTLEDNAEIQKSMTEDISDKENGCTVCSEDEVSDLMDETSDTSSNSQSLKKTSLVSYSPKRCRSKITRRSSSNFLPDDVIVLELAPSPSSPKKSCLASSQFEEVSLHERLQNFQSSSNQEVDSVELDPAKLDNMTVDKVINHVLNMNPWQQRTLLKALDVLEQSAAKSLAAQEELPSTSSSDKSETARFVVSTHDERYPRERMNESSLDHKSNDEIDLRLKSHDFSHSPVKNQSPNRSKSNNSSRRLENVDAEPVMETREYLTIVVRLLKNWGHMASIGLTEIQFLCSQGQCYEFDTLHDISCRGVSDSKGDLSNLVNNRMKTVKEKNMWSSALPSNGYVELEFRLKSSKNFYLSNLVFWNYNKGIKELNIGAKDVEIFINGKQMFKGKLDKGCGNQVFDYSQIIHVEDDFLNSCFARRDSFPTLSPFPSHLKNHLDEDSNQNNQVISHSKKIAANTLEDETEPKSIFPFGTSPRKKSSRNRSANSSIDSLDLSEELRTPSRNYTKKLDSIDWLKNNVQASSRSKNQGWFPSSMTNDDEDDMKNDILSQTGNSCRASMKPIWFEDFRPTSKFSNESRPFCLHQANTDINVDEQSQNLLSEPVVDGRTYNNDKPVKFPNPVSESRSIPIEQPINTSKSQNSAAKFGRRSKAHSAIPISSNNNNGMNLRVRRRGSESSALWNRTSCIEEYWDSLHMFEQCHRGQINDIANCELYRKNAEDINSSNFPKENVYKEDFIIPELPAGKNLTINILSTWGDKHYIGLNGIELFSDDGQQINVDKIWANPADINVLKEYKNDPRVISNLVDGINCTRDDMHLWLAPFTQNQPHYIHLGFSSSVRVAMIRIWNYNKSRIHSLRGAKDVEISLDNILIFRGEIAKASGYISGNSDSFGDTILFTTDDEILEQIAMNDNSFLDCMMEEIYSDEIDIVRPHTGDSEVNSPFTIAAAHNYLSQSSDANFITAETLSLTVTSTWGEPGIVGLTGLEIVDDHGESIPLKPNMITLKDYPKSHSLSKIIDGTYITTSDKHMWFESFDVKVGCTIEIRLDMPIAISSFRIWNYNASIETTYRGVKMLEVKANDMLVSPPGGFLVRKALGNTFFDFAQEFNFSSSSIEKFYCNPVSNVADLPRGFIFQLQLLSTWGDQYYVGLCGIQLFNDKGSPITLEDSNIAAYPASVNVLDKVNGDIRTPDKLIDGIHDPNSSQHSWLAPILPGVVNRVFIIFDYPVTISMIKLWNYSKTSSRGVKQFGLLVDDFLIYNGMLNQFSRKNLSYNTIMFSTDEKIIAEESQTIIRNEDSEQDVQMTNDSVLMQRPDVVIDQALRPQTGVNRNAMTIKSAR